MKSNGKNISSNDKSICQFLTPSIFATLGTCIVLTFIVTCTICYFFRTPHELTGLIVSIIVAYVCLSISKVWNLKQIIVTFFNGFVIYIILVGITSFFTHAIEMNVYEDIREKRVMASFVTPWVSDNYRGYLNVRLAIENEIQDERIKGFEKILKEIENILLDQTITNKDKIVAIKQKIGKIQYTREKTEY